MRNTACPAMKLTKSLKSYGTKHQIRTGNKK